MKIIDYLTRDLVEIDLKPAVLKTDIFMQLLKIAHSHNRIIDEKIALEGLLERERLGSTGVGKEIAIPHTGIADCKTIIPVIGIIKNGMAFESIDDIPVKIVFMILFPENDVTLQLRFLARVSRLLRKEELRKELIKSGSPERIIEIFRSYEDKHFG